MSQQSLRRITRNLSRAATSAVSFDASSSSASASTAATAAHSLSVHIPPADRGRQAEEAAREGKEEAVEVGGDGGRVVESANSSGSGVHYGHGGPDPDSGDPDQARPPLGNRTCTLSTCRHCCQCHILHPAANGYGSCMHRGRPHADCSCDAQCPVGLCGQYDCVSRLGILGLSVSSSFHPAVHAGGDSDDLQQPQRRHSSRAPVSPQLLADEQAAERELAAAVRDIHRMEAAEVAAAPQPAVAPAAVAAAAVPAAVPLATVAAVASHGSLHSIVPFADHTAWIDRCAPAFEHYRQASATNDTEWMASALVELLQLPGKYLHKQRISTHARRMMSRQQMRSSEWQLQRLRDRLRRGLVPAVPALAPAPAAAAPLAGPADGIGVPDDLDDDSQYHDSNEKLDAVAVDAGCTEDDLRAVKQARRLVASGHMHMASRAAATDHRTLDCNDSAVLQRLRQMHPPASRAPMPALPHDAEVPLIGDDAALKRLVRRCNNGKAGGPSGWNGAMLAVLADSPTCMAGIRSIISHITLGRIPAAVRPHITATRLIALAKPNDAPRPIAMGEVFYRVAAVRAVRGAADNARGLLAPHQYGVGVPGGCEHIVHCMQHALTHIRADGPLAAVKIDISNAFNTCQRTVYASTLFGARHTAALLAAPLRSLCVLTAHAAHSADQRCRKRGSLY